MISIIDSPRTVKGRLVKELPFPNCSSGVIQYLVYIDLRIWVGTTSQQNNIPIHHFLLYTDR